MQKLPVTIGLVPLLVLAVLFFYLWARQRRSIWLACALFSVVVTVVLGLTRPLTDSFMAGHLFTNVLWTALACGIIFIITRAAEHSFSGPDQDLQTRHKIRQALHWAETGGVALCVFLIWGSSVPNIGVFLGIIGAGVALSLQEMLLSVAGWGFIIIKHPFDIGDRVEVEEHIGDVIDIGVLYTTLLEVGNWVEADQSTGRLLVVPNSKFFRSVNFNYTKGFPFIWNELTVVVTFESDWKRARDIIENRAREEAGRFEEEVRRHIEKMQSTYPIYYKNLSPIVYTAIVDQGVALTLRYLTPVRSRRTTGHRLCEGILDDFEREGTVDFAYPTTRFYDNRKEGKVCPPV